MDRVNAMNDHMILMEDNNTDLRENVDSVEKDLIDSRVAKQGRNPGVAIAGMLNKWQDDKSWFT